MDERRATVRARTEPRAHCMARHSCGALTRAPSCPRLARFPALANSLRQLADARACACVSVVRSRAHAGDVVRVDLSPLRLADDTHVAEAARAVGERMGAALAPVRDLAAARASARVRALVRVSMRGPMCSDARTGALKARTDSRPTGSCRAFAPWQWAGARPRWCCVLRQGCTLPLPPLDESAEAARVGEPVWAMPERSVELAASREDSRAIARALVLELAGAGE